MEAPSPWTGPPEGLKKPLWERHPGLFETGRAAWGGAQIPPENGENRERNIATTDRQYIFRITRFQCGCV